MSEEMTMASDYLMEVWGVQEETIDCMLAVNGCRMETLESILYWAAGYSSFSHADDWDDWVENF